MLSRFSLDGDWTLKQTGLEEIIPAVVPGTVHSDLLRAGKIEDPYYRDNERNVQWIGETDWVYQRVFMLTEASSLGDQPVLVCEGLDTLAELWLNGTRLGTTFNQHRTWHFPVSGLLVSGENTLEITFSSVLPTIRKRNADRKLPEWHGPLEEAGRGYVRKQASNFGWDWGPVLTTCGIWRSIYLESRSNPSFEDVRVSQEHGQNTVEIRCHMTTNAHTGRDLKVNGTLIQGGEPVQNQHAILSEGTGVVLFKLENPLLWWPAGLGSQPLYEVQLDLVENETVWANWSRRIGLRTLELCQNEDSWGRSFHFEVNGQSFFAKGANWIPVEGVLSERSSKTYRGLLEAARDAHMNMIRVWGGGIYEDDVFYELCDELGLCVWQDFMFACSAYPCFDESFLENVRIEAEQNVRRIRHHASLALWCGNNELEQGLVGPDWTQYTMSWQDYDKLFSDLLPEIVRVLDPGRSYTPGSPHTPGNRTEHADPTRGDAHLWNVWHQREPFEWYRTAYHRFCSEFGFQSFPEPNAVRRFTVAEDLQLTSKVMELHQRSPVGNKLILEYMADWFVVPERFYDKLWLSQILQALAIQYAVEHWRRQMPRSMGTLYWQLNDCWPVASWASLDYYGNWKALHYAAKRFYAPVLVTAVEDITKKTARIYLSTDRPSGFSGEVRWAGWTTDGRRLGVGLERISSDQPGSTCLSKLDLSTWLDEIGNEKFVVSLAALENGVMVSENAVLFSKPKNMVFPRSEVQFRIEEIGKGQFDIQLHAEVPSLWTWLSVKELDIHCSDNFFHLFPDMPRTVRLSAPDSVSVRDLEINLTVRNANEFGNHPS